MGPPQENINIANDEIPEPTERPQKRNRLEELAKTLTERWQATKERNRLAREECEKRKEQWRLSLIHIFITHKEIIKY